MKVSAIVVSHGNAAELERTLPALEPQVDELLVIANIPERVPEGPRVLENTTPLGFAANVKVKVPLTSTRLAIDSVPSRTSRRPFLIWTSPVRISCVVESIASRPGSSPESQPV